jgi:hypothetical protein
MEAGTMKALAFDPGGCTGWTALTAFTYSSGEKEGQVIWDGSLRLHMQHYGRLGYGQELHHAPLWQFLEREQPQLVICERFDPRENEFAIQVSNEYIGVIKAWCSVYNTPLVMQGPDQAKKFAEQHFERLGLQLRPLKPWKDTNDARRHMLFAVCNGVFEDYLPGLKSHVLQEMKR